MSRDQNSKWDQKVGKMFAMRDTQGWVKKQEGKLGKYSEELRTMAWSLHINF